MAEGEEISKIQQGVTDSLNGFGQVYVEAVKEVLENKGKVASGDLYNSLRYEVIPDGLSSVTLQVYASEVMKYVEKGRLPKSKLPNINEIMRWIKFRGIKPRTIKTKGINFKANSFPKPIMQGHKTHKKIGVPRHKVTNGNKSNINSYKAQKRLAFLIAKAIQRDGIKAKKIVAPVVKVVSPHLAKELTEVFVRDFRNALGETLKKAITVDSKRLKIDVNF